MAWDVTAPDTYAESLIANTSTTPGAAAHRTAQKKTDNYASLSSTRLLPLCREDSWCMALNDHVLRVLRHHGLNEVGLYTVFRSVVVAKILYACSAWSGFITACDRHRVDAFLRRSKRCGFCQPDLPSFDQLMEDYEDQLFNKLCNNDGHVLHYLLPPPNIATEHYNLRSASSHNRLLPARTSHLTDANFITRSQAER